MDIKILKDFISLIEVGNYTQAASRRFVTQSAFSRRIQALEKWANTPLIVRKNNKITLTAAGEDVLENAKKIVSRFDYLESQMKVYSDTEPRKIKVVAQNTIVNGFLLNWMDKMEDKCEKISWGLKTSKKQKCIDMFKNNEVDFLFCYKKAEMLDALADKTYKYITVGTEVLIPVASRQSQYSNIDLSRETQSPVTYLTYSMETLFGRALNEKLIFNKPRCQLFQHCQNEYSHILHHMVKRGKGIAWLPMISIAKDLETGELVTIGDDSWNLHFDIILFYRDNNLNALQQKIIDNTEHF